MSDVRRLPVGEGNEEITLALDELAREGARRMIAAALRAEADEYVARFSDELDEDGHRLVVCNGRARERRGGGGGGADPGPATSWTRTVIAWSSVTVARGSGG